MMEEKKNKRKRLLLALVALWCLIILQRQTFWVEQKRVPLKYVKGNTFTKVSRNSKEESDLIVRLDLLKGRPKAEGGNPKNIFVPIEAFLPPPPPPSPPPPLPPPPSPPPTPPGPTAEELAIMKARQELGQFRYLGYLNREGREEAFLSRGKTLFIVKRGDTIQGQFILNDLEANHITIKDQQTNLEVTITLSKK